MSAVRRVVENTYVEADAPAGQATADTAGAAEPVDDGPDHVDASDVKRLRAPRRDRSARRAPTPAATVPRPLRLGR